MHTFIKTLFIWSFLMLPGICIFAQDTFFDSADTFFSQFVKEGQVDYAKIKENPAQLNQLLKQIEAYGLAGQDKSVQQAFLINAYNLYVIKSVVDAYPIPSPQVVAGFFDTKKHKINGKSLTLEELEKQELFQVFADPRFHFVLVCAAKSCPPIIPQAYKPDLLENQLIAQTRKALNNENFIRVDDQERQVALSHIFSWYMSDFGSDSKEVIDYINQFREKSISNDYKITFYPYDWSLNEFRSSQNQQASPTLSNVQAFTPSVLLKKNQIEIKLFNNLYTQTAFRDENRNKIALGERQTFFTGIYQVTYGVSKSGRVNVGIETYLNSVTQNPLSGTEGKRFSKTALGYLGPRIRLTPFVNLPKFSVTSSLQIPLSRNLEFVDEEGNSRFLTHNRVSWLTQFFYDKIFGDFQIFTEIDLLYRFKTSRTSFRPEAFFRTPVTVFLSYFPTHNSTININAQYSPAWGENGGNFGYLNDFVQIGLGGKYQITREINFELLYTNFITSKGQGAGQTFNLGIIFLR